MAGHSKWKNIKHKKEKEDAKKGKVFTKIVKEISIAAKIGGGDPAGNIRLRLLIEKAKEYNTPKELVTRAIKRGCGENDDAALEQVFYEGYGPEGTAIIIEALTDNRNRTISDLRHFFSKHGGHMGQTGTVSWMFDELGQIEIDPKGKTEDQIFELMLDSSVENIKSEPEVTHLFCSTKNLDTVRHDAEKVGLCVKGMSIVWLAKTPVELSEEGENKVFEFIEGLEELEDVQNVFVNV